MGCVGGRWRVGVDRETPVYDRRTHPLLAEPGGAGCERTSLAASHHTPSGPVEAQSTRRG